MPKDDWYNNDYEYAFEQLQSSKKGLSGQESEERLTKYGYNELIETGKKSVFRMFFEQFTDPMVIILLIAIVISIFTSLLSQGHGEEHGFVDAIVISAIVIFNAIFGFVQEYRSEQALEALIKMAAPKALVLRDTLWKEIESRYLVPGDVISLESGDLVPADGRIFYDVGFSADESILTGESVAVRKISDTISLDHPSVGDMKNMVHQGTTITAGKGRAVITSTGMNTRFGSIAEMVQKSEKDMTPLQLDLEDLGKKLGLVVIALCIIVFAAEILRDVSESWLDELLAAIALAVSAIPEGLPAVVTITLAIGVQRMVRENAIVRRLPSVETLGSTTVICSDKTGTMTKNEMTVLNLFVNGQTITVTGAGYNKIGQFYRASAEFDPKNDVHTSKLLEIGQLCTNSMLQPDPSRTDDFTIVGDPTEGAILVVAEKAGLVHSETKSKYKEITEISFDSARKRMTSVCKDETGKIIAFSKGAPEILLPLCTRILENGNIRQFKEGEKENIAQINAGFAENALRVLAFAYRPLDEEIPDWEPEIVEKNLIFVGLMGMIDPPRDEVKAAIQTCVKAGIRTIMITGDHELTGRAIAIDVGLIERDGDVVTGAMIDDMSEEEFVSTVRTCNVFTRVAPRHKMQIIKVLKEMNEVVAMTGDGVNDAPAIKTSDVGVSMGVRGADVTKESSDVILTDDNFATIVTAVERGREIYSNIRKFVRFLLAANFDELFLVFTVIMLGFPLPITAIQILWLNLATDGFPALALGVDPPVKGVMNRRPRKPGKKMMDRGMVSFILVAGFFAFLSSLFVFFWALATYGPYIPSGLELIQPDFWSTAPWNSILTHARTAVFAAVVTFELMFVWNCRDEYNPIWRTDILNSKALIGAVLLSLVLTLATIYVPFLQGLFGTVALNGMDWIVILVTCIPSILIPPHIIFGHKNEVQG
jgi:Ca2+-transporting ATPase